MPTATTSQQNLALIATPRAEQTSWTSASATISAARSTAQTVARQKLGRATKSVA